MRTILAAVALAIALHATPASAQESRQQTDDRERRFRDLDGFRRRPSDAGKGQASSSGHAYQGMYFRPEAGFGYMSVSVNGGKLSGPSGSFGLHFGGAVARDVLVGLHFYEVFMANPTASGAAEGMDTSNSAIAAAAIGPELTVCLPGDFYWSATVALTRAAVAQDTGAGTETVTSKAGFGARAALGYDHWAESGKWSLGAAVQATYSRNQIEELQAMANTWSAGVAFSVSWD